MYDHKQSFTCSPVLMRELRGDYEDIVIRGNIAVVGENGLAAYLGDPYQQAFYRSAAKPIQTLPFVGLGLHQKYHFTPEEIAMMGASHLGEPVHVALAQSMMDKTGFTEEDMIMGAVYPHSRAEMKRLASQKAPKRRIYHNCSGKHLGMLATSRELGDPPGSYFKVESAMGQESLRYLSCFCDLPPADIGIAVDGCGVPIFRVPLYHMALSYLRLARPELLHDNTIAEAARIMTEAYHLAPYVVRGYNTLCEIINSDPNLIGKLGAGGVYCIGLKKEKLGIALKTEDGNLDCLPMVVNHLLQELGYDNAALYQSLNGIIDPTVRNDAGLIVGEKLCDFHLTSEQSSI